MKLKKEILILVVVMVAAVAYIALRKTDRTHFDLPRLEPVAAKKIDRLELKKDGQTVTVEKKGGKWLVMPQKWPADEDKIRGMAEIAADLTLTALISESKSYARYGLDEAHRISVRAFAGEKLVRAFDVGKSAATYQHTHVRVDGDPNVYHAREDFQSRFDRTADQLRDLSVMAFESGDIEKITLTRGDKTATLERIEEKADAKKGEKGKDKAAAPPKTFWQLAGGGPVDQESVKGLVSSLSRLSCEKFMDEKKKEGLGQPMATLLLNGKKEYRLEIFDKAGKGEDGGHPALSSESPYPFVLSGYQVDSIKENLDKILGPEKGQEPADKKDPPA